MELAGIEYSWSAALLVMLAAAAGGLVQSSLGFGAGFVLVPALAVAAPELLPGSVLITILPFTMVMVVRAGREIDARMVGRITLGLVPGTLIGAVIVTTFPTRGLTVLVAVILLAAVGLSVSGFELAPTSRREVAAGVLSGLTSTTAALGGPTVALLYQSASGRVLRSTLPSVWLVGGPLSLLALSASGELAMSQLTAGGVLALAALVGWGLAEPLVRRFDDRFLRPAVLGWAGIGAVLALVRAVAG